MDRSILGLPDPLARASNAERRRSVRQKLNTPVYASFNGPGPQSSMVVDLSELLDLNEDGFAVQTSERLETNRAVTLCLDLPETKKYLHGSGQVIWSDDTGRGGIQFSGLAGSSRQILKEWLFANLLIACSNHAARTEQLARREEQDLPELDPVGGASNVVPISDGSATLSSLEAVRREVREIGDDADAVFQLIAERALSLTEASGAALAFLTDDRMICRARAGEPAPPLGAPVDVKQGLSGECMRSGLLVSCEDTENDPRVDPEVCRALGIGSLMATPIVCDFRVVGLLEVFSPHPRLFAKADEMVLNRLVELIPKAHHEVIPPEKLQPETPASTEATSGEAASDVPTLNSAVETGLAPSPKAIESASAEPSSLQVDSVEADSIKPDSMHATREALWEEKPEVPDQVSQQVPEPAPTAPSYLLHWALLALAILVVAMVLGYLVGSTMKKRWTDSAQASQQRPIAETVSLRSTVDRNAQTKSLADLRMAADQGDADAQWQMGVRYHNGEGVPQDDAQAMQWFQRAGEQGNVAAQSALGSYYWAGRGVPKDLSESYFWSYIAMAQGDENSKSRLEGLSSQMTRAQVSAARQKAEVWTRQHNAAKPARN